MQLSGLDIGIVLAYLAGIFLLAQWVSRAKAGHDRDAEDYFLAGKALPWWAIGASLIAANISAEQIIGMSGSGYAIGLAIASYEWMAAATLLIVGKWFLPVFLRNRIFTMPQFLEQRYGRRIRTVMAVFWIGLYVFVNLTSILWLGSLAIAHVSGVDQTWALLGLAAFALAYQIHGGLRAVALTDVVQVVLLVRGGLLLAGIMLERIGGDADALEHDPGQQQPAQHQQHHLHHVGERHRAEPAMDLVGKRERGQAQQRPGLVHAGDVGDRQRAQPQDRGQVHEHVQADPEDRHHRADAAAVALLEELRHREDAVAQEHRQEPLAHDQQGGGRHPFVGRDRQADRVARPGHADDLLGRDVGRDQRGADRPPRQRLAGQEVVLGVAVVPRLRARDPLREEEDAGEVGQHDPDIQTRQLHPSPPAIAPRGPARRVARRRRAPPSAGGRARRGARSAAPPGRRGGTSCGVSLPSAPVRGPWFRART